jgi:HK97 family phage prohead protease
MSIKDKTLYIDSSNFEVKNLEGESSKLSVTGYANTTMKDRVGDVILQEAWMKGALNNYLNNPVILAFHDHTQPIGYMTNYHIDANGLHIEAEISKTAGKIYDLVKEGIIRAFSVGFKIKDASYDSDADTFNIKDVELLEVSVVSVPANASSLFSVKKSLSTNEYLELKKMYSKAETSPNNNLGSQQTKEEKTKVGDENKVSLTKEELDAMLQKAVDDAKAAEEAEKARKKAIEDIAITAGKTEAEKLSDELAKRFDDENTSMKEKLAGIEDLIKEKMAEFEALNRNKMSFQNPTGSRLVTQKDIDAVVLTSIISGKPMESLKHFKALTKDVGETGVVYKAVGDTAHTQNLTTPADWENIFSTRLYEDIMDKTIVEPLFNNRITMTSRVMTFPWNPEAGYAQWIADTAYNSGTGFGDTGTSTGTAATHLIRDNTITAQKLATKEFIGYEEEEDTILPLVPIIRDAVLRRMVRSTDTELLRGNVGADTGSGTGLINGVSTIATDNSATYTPAGAFGTAVTVADLQSTRRVTGRYGLMPGEIIYVVSQQVMYDLLEDPDFRTMDLVGQNATILRGQIGMVNGSPVVVSDSFAANAVSTVQAVALNPRNYLFGELRGLMVERDRDIINQKNVIVATRRFGFAEIVPGTTTSHHACAALVMQAS